MGGRVTRNEAARKHTPSMTILLNHPSQFSGGYWWVTEAAQGYGLMRNLGKKHLGSRRSVDWRLVSLELDPSEEVSATAQAGTEVVTCRRHAEGMQKASG